MSSPALDILRRRVAALEGNGKDGHGPALPLGLPGFQDMATGALHEIASAAGHEGAALGFAAFLLDGLARLAARPVLWLAEGEMPHAPGLARFGLGPERLVMVVPGRPKALLWALEEAARSSALAAVLAEVRGMDFTAARRLQLAAGHSGTTLLLLNRAASPIVPALTRWRVESIPGAEGRWRLDLLRCRGRSPDDSGRVANWEVEWNGTAHNLGLVAPAGYRPAVPVHAGAGARVA